MFAFALCEQTSSKKTQYANRTPRLLTVSRQSIGFPVTSIVRRHRYSSSFQVQLLIYIYIYNIYIQQQFCKLRCKPKKYIDDVRDVNVGPSGTKPFSRLPCLPVPLLASCSWLAFCWAKGFHQQHFGHQLMAHPCSWAQVVLHLPLVLALQPPWAS